VQQDDRNSEAAPAEPGSSNVTAPSKEPAVVSLFKGASGNKAASRIAKPKPAPSGLLNDFILESLSFRSMRNREEEVADAHGETFDWIFNPSKSNHSDAQNALGHHYTKWLSTDEMGSIYWGELTTLIGLYGYAVY
jgi:hypothetical protein